MRNPRGYTPRRGHGGAWRGYRVLRQAVMAASRRNGASENPVLLPPVVPATLHAMEPPVKDRSHWRVRKFTSFEEQRTQQVRDWQALSGAERRQAAWELVFDYWVGMKGMHPDELRLQRTVTKLTRV